MKMDKLPTLEEFSIVFFGWQTKIEDENIKKGLGTGGDFRRVFKDTIKQILFQKITKNFDEKLDKVAEDFFTEFKKIKMDDLLYQDTNEGIRELIKEIDGIVVFTTGDEDYQPAKIERSTILKIIENSLKELNLTDLFFRFLFAKNKEKEMVGVIEEFSRINKCLNPLVIDYDDNAEKFILADEYISEYRKQNNIKCNCIYVWAKRGRIAANITKEKENILRKNCPKFETVENLEQLTSIIKKRKNDQKIIVFLDFDGALSDNIKMRKRQSSVAYKYALKFIVDSKIGALN